MKRFSLLCLLSTLLYINTFCISRADTITSLKDKLQSSLVVIGNDTAMGTGTVVKSDSVGSYIVTNKHVCNIFKVMKPSKDEYESLFTYSPTPVIRLIDMNVGSLGQIIKVADNVDLCIVYVLIPNLPALKLANSSPETNSEIYTFSFPADEKTFTHNKLLGIGDIGWMIAYVSDLHVRPGASGTGVLNEQGELIALVSGFMEVDKKNPKKTLSFMVPLEILKPFLRDILD